MLYKDKIVWITGASSGIGAALAKSYYNDGARLILSARREKALQEVREGFGGDPERVKILPLDLADPGSLKVKADACLSLFGGIDILVNNGGISQRSLFAETDPETIRRIMEVNFFGAAELTHAVLPHMLEKKSGHIVVTASVTGKIGTKYRTGYAASKHALYGFYDSLRQEVYDYNIAVTLLCPGFIKTDVSVNALTGDGSAFGKVGDKHKSAMSADEMAAKIRARLAARKDEIIVAGFQERLAMLLKRISPALLNKILRKSKVT